MKCFLFCFMLFPTISFAGPWESLGEACLKETNEKNEVCKNLQKGKEEIEKTAKKVVEKIDSPEITALVGFTTKTLLEQKIEFKYQNKVLGDPRIKMSPNEVILGFGYSF